MPLTPNDIEEIRRIIREELDRKDTTEIRPIWPDPYNPSIPEQSTKSTCAKCGLVLYSGVKRYCCTTMDCPVGLGPTRC